VYVYSHCVVYFSVTELALQFMTLCCYVQSRFDEAAVALKRELDYYSRVDNQGLLNKLVMGLVLVHLHRGDYVAADQAFQATLR